MATALPSALLALVIFLTLLLLGTRSASAAARLVVSPHGPYTTIQDALRDAHAGDVIQVQGGIYRGNVVVDKSILLEGVDHPVLDAENRGTVVTLNAPDVTVRGFEIRNSGSEPDRDHAGITANAPRATIENNTLRQVLFGIFIAQAADSIVRGNDVTSKDEYDSGRKGDAIRLWYSPRVIVADNHVHHARDVVVWYSQGVQIQNNLIEHGRYGVHLMYCDDARIENNRVLNNSVGVYSMYSQNILLRGNDVRGQRGPSGYALGFKDTGNVRVENNLLVDNRGGIFMDGTPFSPNDTAHFERNVLAFNDIAVTMMPAVRGADFSDNVFWENIEQMAVNGGGAKAEANRWRSNYWSDYAGLDANGDGLGDTPYVAEKFFENMTDREPMLRALMYSPAAQTLEFAATLFPLVKPLPKLRDAAPRLVPPPLAREGGDRARQSDRNPSAFGVPARRGARYRSAHATTWRNAYAHTKRCCSSNGDKTNGCFGKRGRRPRGCGEQSVRQNARVGTREFSSGRGSSARRVGTERRRQDDVAQSAARTNSV